MEDYLCSFAANTYGIQFVSFTIQDKASGFVYFHVGPQAPLPDSALNFEEPRKIKYRFNPAILRAASLNTILKFNATHELPNFTLIEKHFVGEKHFATYRSEMDGPLEAGKMYTQEMTYKNEMSESLIREAIQHSWSHKVEALYFVNNKLVMHNKAVYLYSSDIPGMQQ